MGARTAGLLAAGVVAVVLIASCGVQGGGDRDPGRVESDPKADVPSALDNPNHPSFPEPLIDVDDVVSGGPPPDGIPPIDEPNFDVAEDVEWLDDDDPVLSLTLGDETRAYPLAILTWHEIVNDVVDDTPVTVTYCPLCNSGFAFLREIDGRVLDFGTSGMLYIDNLVMYDRQTESLWPQFTGQASIGHLTGTQLELLPISVVGWQQFRDAHPDSLVLNRDTGHSRDYGRNPYVGYDDPDGGLLVPPPGGTDDRLPVKERVIGIEIDDTAVAVLRSAVAEAGVLEVSVAGADVVLWHLPGQASALDTSAIREGADIGSVTVFRSEVDGQELTFTREGEKFVDDQTGSEWNIFGQAVAGELEGSKLPEQRADDTFWFAWVGFQPDTELRTS